MPDLPFPRNTRNPGFISAEHFDIFARHKHNVQGIIKDSVNLDWITNTLGRLNLCPSY